MCVCVFVCVFVSPKCHHEWAKFGVNEPARQMQTSQFDGAYSFSRKFQKKKKIMRTKSLGIMSMCVCQHGDNAQDAYIGVYECDVEFGVKLLLESSEHIGWASIAFHALRAEKTPDAKRMRAHLHTHNSFNHKTLTPFTKQQKSIRPHISEEKKEEKKNN